MNCQHFGSNFGKKATLQPELTIHISVWDISVGFERGPLKEKAASLSLQSLTPPLPQPPIRLRGSPLCGHFMLVCEVMTKLESAMFYFLFLTHAQRTSSPALRLSDGFCIAACRRVQCFYSETLSAQLGRLLVLVVGSLGWLNGNI